MLEHKTSNQNLTAWRGNIPIENLYTAGPAGDKFLSALKSRGKFVGTRCTGCNQTYVPARLFCERCFAELQEYVDVENMGEVVSFTESHIDLDGNRRKKPVALAAVRLNGATTTLVHRLLPGKSAPQIGMRVKAVFEPKSKRKGSILDLRGFEPA